MRKYYIILYVFLIALYSSCNDCHEIDVPYTEEEPYNAIEETDIQLTYTIGENKYRRVPGLLIDNPYLEAWTEITNTGDKGGEFTVTNKFKTTLDDEINFEDTKYIGSGSTEKFYFKKELDMYVQVKSIGYNVSAPYVKVSKEVTKTRTITKYRKCNTCEEDCGEYVKNKKSSSWIWIIIGVIALIIWSNRKKIKDWID